ncbi:MAG: hypothetical protein KAT43_05720 [Nanoarchaeota archaeon]|nr:hypothetical protein [Nanoarchaeota archaeon]
MADIKLSKDSSPLEKELGLKDGMHGRKECSHSAFVESLVGNLGDNYIIFRSYNNEAVFKPRVVLCGYTHTDESRAELKKVLDKVVSRNDIILLEGDRKVVRAPEEYPIKGDPFADFFGKIKKLEFNDDILRLALQAQISENTQGYHNLAIKRNIDQFAPSIVKNIREDAFARVFQRIGHRHIIEWMEILQRLEKEDIPYIAIIPKVNANYTEKQNAFYNRLARTNAVVEF